MTVGVGWGDICYPSRVNQPCVRAQVLGVCMRAHTCTHPKPTSKRAQKRLLITSFYYI